MIQTDLPRETMNGMTKMADLAEEQDLIIVDNVGMSNE